MYGLERIVSNALYTIIDYSKFLNSGFYYSSLRCNNENEIIRLKDIT